MYFCQKKASYQHFYTVNGGKSVGNALESLTVFNVTQCTQCDVFSALGFESPGYDCLPIGPVQDTERNSLYLIDFIRHRNDAELPVEGKDYLRLLTHFSASFQ